MKKIELGEYHNTMTPAREPKQRFLNNSGCGSIVWSLWKLSGSSWDTSGRHLGDIWEASGSQEQPGEPRGGQRQVWTKN